MHEEEIFRKQLRIFSNRKEAEKFLDLTAYLIDRFELNFANQQVSFSATESGKLSLSIEVGKRIVVAVERKRSVLHLILLQPAKEEFSLRRNLDFIGLIPFKADESRILVRFNFAKFDLIKNSEIIDMWYQQVQITLQSPRRANRDTHNISFYKAITDLIFRRNILDSINFQEGTKETFEKEI